MEPAANVPTNYSGNSEEPTPADPSLSQLSLDGVAEGDNIIAGDIIQKKSEETYDLQGPPSHLCVIWLQIRGIFLAAGQQSAGNYLFFVLVTDYKEFRFSPTAVLTSRFLIMLILCLLLVPLHRYQFGHQIFQNVWPLTEPGHLWTIIRLIMRGLSGSAAIILNFYALQYINPGDVSSILWSNLLIIGLLSCLLLGERLYIFQLFSALLALFGVLVIARPPFIFGGSGFSNKLLTGVGFSLGSMLSSTATTINLRTLGNVHYILVNIIFAGIALVAAIIVRFATDTHSVPGRPLETYIFIVLIGILACTSLISITLSLKYETAGPVSVARSSEVVFSFLLQMFSGIYPDYINVIGASLVLSSIVLVGFQAYLRQQEESNYLRKRLWFVLR